MADPISSIPGVASGVDWKSLVEQIVTLERRPAARLEAAALVNDRRKAALGEFQKVLQTLQDSARALNVGATGVGAASGLRSFTVSASGTGAAGRAVLAATTDGGAAPGDYGVEVQQLASAQKLTAGAGFAASAPLPTGTLTLRRPGAAPEDPPLATVTIAEGDTLVTLRDRLNQLNTGPTPTGVGVTLIGASATDRRLSLTAASSGEANGFVLDDAGSGLLAQLGLDPAGASPPFAVAAQDARLVVDGVAITRPTNGVSDVLPGVTLTLSAVGTAALSVTRNTDAASDAAKAFVEAYNKVVTFVRDQSGAGKPLANDRMLRNTRAALAQMFVAPGAAADGTALPSELATLAAAGLSLQKDGTLALDAKTFTGLVGGRTADLTAMLGSRMGAVGDYLGLLTQPLTGVIDQRESGIVTLNGTMQKRVDQIDARLDRKRSALLAQYSKYEASLGRLNALQSTMAAQFNGLTTRSS
jgi:flagellar hook-associated protein 2